MGLWDKLFNKTPVLKGYISEEHYPMYENAKGETVEMSPEQYQRVQGENVPNDVATTYGIATLPFATMSAPIGVGSALGNAVLNSAFGGGVYGGINGAINSINNGENPLLGTAKGFGEGALVGGALGVPAHYTGELLNYGAKKALPYIRNVRNGGGLFDRLASETGLDIDGHYNLDDFNFNTIDLPRSRKHQYSLETISENDLPSEIVKRLKRGERSQKYNYLTKDGYVNSGQYDGNWTKESVRSAINDYNNYFNNKQLKNFIDSDLVQNYHKNTNLDFNATPENEIVAEKQFYKSPVYNNRQSSSYSVSLDNDGNVYYKRKSNHWGDFGTNIYADDILKQNAQEYENFKALNPDATPDDFLESLGYDISDQYGRVGRKSYHWNLNGGNNDARNSQSGYIKIGNINNKTPSNLFDKIVRQ